MFGFISLIRESVGWLILLGIVLLAVPTLAVVAPHLIGCGLVCILAAVLLG